MTPFGESCRGFIFAWLLLSPCLVVADVDPMIAIPGGRYQPLFRTLEQRTEAKKKVRGSRATTIAVAPFLIDAYPVTQQEFQRFVTANPRWRRSAQKPIFADRGYLRSWKDDLTPADRMRAPVTEVSWFAAKAYCGWRGTRLPRAAEWEYVALASERAADARTDARHIARILDWYATPTPADGLPEVGRWRNWWGVYDLHGLIWEWVADFNSELTTGESRGDSDIEKDLFCGAGALQASEKARADYAAFMRYAFRGSLQGTYAVKNLGFRCAKDAGKKIGKK